ncbi:hypothetical protein B0H19DRAFT_1276989 [Mycena capillaripes]|nr:hypothetical protein B0H19DRAFT_1276989 [Mycena capillaripes]
MSTSLSVFQAITILRTVEQKLSWLQLNLPAYARSVDDDASPSRNELQKWLDALASLLVRSTPGTASKEVCAMSLSILPSECVVTVAFNFTANEPDISRLVTSIWKWVQKASEMPEETSEHNDELLKLILKVSSERIRRRIKDKGGFVLPLTLMILDGDSKLEESRKKFLQTAHSTQERLQRYLGTDKPDFTIAAAALRAWVKQYEVVASKVREFSWLGPFEAKFLASGKSPETSANRNRDLKPPSLVRYMEKLFKPYTQYLLIRKIARKSLVRPALTKTLRVNVLPSSLGSAPAPSEFQSMDNDSFDARVRSYLTAASISYLTNAAPDEFRDAIHFYMERINEEKDGKGLPPLLAPHCECTLLRHHLDEHLGVTASSTGAPYAHIGVSKLSCFQCALYFQAYNACALGPPLYTRGCYAEVFPCAVPTGGRGRDQADDTIENEMGVQLMCIIGQVLAVKKGETRRSSLSPVKMFMDEGNLRMWTQS